MMSRPPKQCQPSASRRQKASLTWARVWVQDCYANACLPQCWKKPFSAQLSPVQVSPDSHISMGTLLDSACLGRKRLNFISQPVVDALWASLRSFPPKQAMVAVVLTDIVSSQQHQQLLRSTSERGRRSEMSAMASCIWKCFDPTMHAVPCCPTSLSPHEVPRPICSDLAPSVSSLDGRALRLLNRHSLPVNLR